MTMSEQQSPLVKAVIPITHRKYLPLVTDFAIVVVGHLQASDGKNISQLVNKLSDLWPMDGMKFYKRIRRRLDDDGKPTNDFEMLMCDSRRLTDGIEQTPDDSGNLIGDLFCKFPLFDNQTVDKRIRKLLSCAGQEDLCAKFGRFSLVPLPKNRPLTRKQYDFYAKIWSMGGFREDPELESTLSQSTVSEEKTKFLGSIITDFNPKKPVCSHSVSCCASSVTLFDFGEKGSKVLCRSNCACDEKPYRHAVMELIASWAAICKANREAAGTASSQVGQYLCNSLEILLDIEPCAMCAMALVHSRIQTVYFVRPNLFGGAFQSQIQLHLNESLNHRFKVFRVDLTDSNQ